MTYTHAYKASHKKSLTVDKVNTISCKQLLTTLFLRMCNRKVPGKDEQNTICILRHRGGERCLLIPKREDTTIKGRDVSEDDT